MALLIGGQRFFALSNNIMVDGEGQENVEVYSSFESAKQIMDRQIQEAKKDAFWWDSENDKLTDGYEVSENHTSFEAYKIGYYHESHESWYIQECTLDIGLDTENANCAKAYDIYLKEYYNHHDKTNTPVSYNEFVDNEWQDSDCRKYYEDKICNHKNNDNEM